jgi:hypothetical protein
MGRRRCTLRRPRNFFSSTRRSTALRVGLVARRGVRGANAVASFSASWSSAALRFCVWERKRLALERTTGPRDSFRRSFSASPSTPESSTRKVAMTLVSDRLACWPPGPPDVVTRNSISSAGIVRRGRTAREPSSFAVGPNDTRQLPAGSRTMASCDDDATRLPDSSKSSQRSSRSPSAMTIAF